MWNVGNGVNVIAPLISSTTQVPWFGTVILVTSPFESSLLLVAPAGTTKLTLVPSTDPSASASNPDPLSTRGFTVTTEFAGLALLISLLATGAIFTYSTVTVALALKPVPTSVSL